MKPKSKATTIIILAVTLLLAGVAIFTAIRLYQLRTQPVAPNAPSSRPAAGGTICGGFAGTKCPTGEECVYENGGRVAPYPDASGTCQPTTNQKTSGTCEISFSLAAAPQCNSVCTDDSGCPTDTICLIASGASSGFCRNPECDTETDCLCGTSTATATATATSTATATATATSSTNPSGTPNSCGGTCGSNSNCSNGLICYNGSCKNPSCTSDTDCVCGTASTEAPSLPDSGSSWPSVFGMGLGVLVILGSLLLAL